MILSAMWRKKRIDLQIHLLVEEEGLIVTVKCKKEVVTFFPNFTVHQGKKMKGWFACQEGSASHHSSPTDHKTMYFVSPRKPLPTACPHPLAVSAIFSFRCLTSNNQTPSPHARFSRQATVTRIKIVVATGVVASG
eukprot:TRINITY_DN8850_c0_g1_i4.p1 TRINITY_DN8850_c0_g1~~TRINITY_DN8850_c0_g1_i4.p1  ORF type:complete len:136 (-),score=11.76 TRINITY_DN8850_c0_g1_i4:1930-2337(-)